MTPAPDAPVSVVLALGSNLGDRAAILVDAARVIADLERLEVAGVSPVFESAAVKPDGVDPAAPPYLNAVVTARYTGDPHELLDAINGIEDAHGRVRTERWGDRTLDIDIIVFGELELSDDRLTIPHPRAWQRDFVLAPWLALDPDAAIPGRGRVDELLAAAASSVRRQGSAPGLDGRP
ncbi:2-amino-4-hydroxy-6-hydroxymethyldihydropteridine diphosphokinase [Cryobacterium sp. Sr8]|uniref:2-amino-4-hydroxy-6- hydroxymethyldihydropteridine diphosphokinase n=1 Tax=Cryobacterium sp. Sr8 TaxID=1259203 RepID=UPI001068D719|nr:2-amino-4-hydroxy-6-hydroxymethyldihydropteridine diphosphokinase [Cryobacterium sp. Sr8]TFD77213.1 2-amino-4-hydroxy-6-hydroxymethyldihydropteridine diphosphokinase [Cryobacterium sp. Sr8]